MRWPTPSPGVRSVPLMIWPFGYFTVGTVTWTLDTIQRFPSLMIPSVCQVSACRRTWPTSFQVVSRSSCSNSRAIRAPCAAVGRGRAARVLASASVATTIASSSAATGAIHLASRARIVSPSRLATPATAKRTRRQRAPGAAGALYTRFQMDRGAQSAPAGWHVSRGVFKLRQPVGDLLEQPLKAVGLEPLAPRRAMRRSATAGEDVDGADAGPCRAWTARQRQPGVSGERNEG